MKDRTIFIFTQQYPYGAGETFIENELSQLSKDFKTVYVFPIKCEGIARALPKANIEVVCLFDQQEVQKWKLLFNGIFLMVQILFFEFKKSKHPLAFLKSFSLLKSVLLINIYRSNKLHDFIKNKKDENIIFYSFWTDDWATVLSILKKKKIITSFFTRGHGYDIYTERWKYGVIPFRNFQLANLSIFFVVSKGALNYLTSHYPLYKSKFKLSYLTIPSSGENPFYKESPVFTIVSCSNLIPLKRVELTIEILKNVNENVHWIHFGDGALKLALLEKAKLLSSNIKVEFRGAVKNAQILDFYKNHSVNLFIHLSETEGGVPISLQEAASFGIPLLGTNVGGIPEIVTESTGILIEKDFDPVKVAQSIIDFKNSEKNTAEYRKRVREYWKENFDATKNYENFCELLLS